MLHSLRRYERVPMQADIRVTDRAGNLAMLSLLDISVSGLRTDGLVHFSTGTAVEVEFACGARQLGCTMWRDEFSSGIMFDQLLDPADLDRLRTAVEQQPHF